MTMGHAMKKDRKTNKSVKFGPDGESLSNKPGSEVPLKGILKKSNNVAKSKTGKPKLKQNKTKYPFTKVDDATLPENQRGDPLAKNNGKGKKTLGGKAVKRSYSKKELRQMRLNSKKHGDVVRTLITDWELLRHHDTKAEEKHKLVERMLLVSKEKLIELSRARDTSRIVETMLKLGTEAQRWTIFAELRESLRALSMSQYGKHVVLKLITYGVKEYRLELLKLFRGHVVKLLRHKHSAEVVEILYNDYANASQRALILQEVYTCHFAAQVTANNIRSLQQAIDLNPDKRNTILANLNGLLVTMISKGLMRLSIVQHLLLEYLTIMLRSSDLLKLQSTAPPPVETTKLVHEEAEPRVEETPTPRREESLSVLVEAILEIGVVSMLHTREGVKAALALLWICPPRERKTLIKSLQTCIVSIAENEHGHIFLMGLLDAVDDTKLLAKTVVKELLDDLEDVVSHPHSRKVLLYALTPRDPRHFAPDLISACIAGGDESPFTKKPLAVRALELRSPAVGLLPALLRLVAGSTDSEEASEDTLIRLFVGSAEHPVPLADRGRVVLLGEILIRSSPHELQFSTATSHFKRTGTQEAERLTLARQKSSSFLVAEDLAELEQARKRALHHFVKSLLAQDTFQPVGLTMSSRKVPFSPETKRMIQMRRRKRALVAVEAESIKKRKPTVKAFITRDEDDDVDDEEEKKPTVEPMDTSAEETDVLPANMPFLERPEGHLLVKRLLQNDKSNGSHDFGRLVCELVPEQTLLAWLTCNRSCFTLVHLYESQDEEICKRLSEMLRLREDLITTSPLPGAKVLAKHLLAK